MHRVVAADSELRVLVVAANRAEDLRRALSSATVGPSGPPVNVVAVTDPIGALGVLRAQEVEVVVVAEGIDRAAVYRTVIDTAPTARLVVMGEPEDPMPALVSEYVATEHTAALSRAAVHRAGRLRALALAGDLHDRAFALANLTEPLALANAAVALTREAAAADHAVYVDRNQEGVFHVIASVGPSFGGPPLPMLLRWTERLERDRSTSVVAETRSDRHLGGVVVGNTNHFHGVLWVSRSLVRRTFSARELAAVGTIAQRTLLAVEHDRLVKDLQHRLLSMEATRTRLEEDARAASVGRLAVDALIALRDPLAYTRSNLRAAAASPDLPAGGSAARHLEYALQGLGRAEHAVEDLSRVSQGRDRVAVEVRQLIESALAQVRPFTHPETVEISENAVVFGNPGRLAQALAEVLRNADQAAGGTRVDVSATRMNDLVAIEVADDGEGIPADLLARVTEPFFSTRGRAGLGLTTAKDVIERAGGTLEIRSRRGVGTVIRIQLPGERVDDELVLGGDADDEEVGDLGDLLGK